ncbi:MAG: hypothetical protein EU539_01835 [Promethearchaeota archaeon]|nr:MAG: hypothetical protein EU539_01835 [Candidatus Lokiarchaeota archaeon]
MNAKLSKELIVKKKKGNYEENNSQKLDNYLNIWELTNPHYKDINNKISLIKPSSILIISIFFMIITYSISNNLIISITIAIITLILCFLAFHDSFFLFKSKSFKQQQYINIINPFEDYNFFFLQNNFEILFHVNKIAMKTVAMAIFQVKIIPENIHPTLNQFIKSLNELRVPFSFQIAQTCLNLRTKLRRKTNKKEQDEAFQTSIYFCTSYDLSGFLTTEKIKCLVEKVNEFIEVMRSNFSANFPHYNVKLLTHNEIIQALRIFFLKIDTLEDTKEHYNVESKKVSIPYFLKISASIFLLIYSPLMLFFLNTPIFLILMINLLFVIVILWVLWRELLTVLALENIRKKHDLIYINPFKDLQFFKVKNHPESLYCHVKNNILLNIKVLNLKYASFKFHSKVPLFYPGKVYRAIIQKKIMFGYTLCTAPMSFYMFDRKCFKFLIKRTQKKIDKIKNDKEGKNWLDMRSGAWRSIITLSALSYKCTEELKPEDFLELEIEQSKKITSIENAFKMNFSDFEFISLKNGKLISGILCQTLKNKYFTRGGTHLNYLIFQGKALILLAYVADEFKKGVETKIAAEFNSPLQLKNFISFGSTINTEYLEEEVPVGFLREQINSLLITNGKSNNREDLAIKIVAELVKRNTPSLIFDFSGNWSRLINIFNNTIHESNFLHFKLGSAFTIDPIRSDIAHDKFNIEYLDYIFDSYALIFKKDEKTMDVFKNTILRNPELDITTLNLELKNQQDWQKSPITESLISLFDEFTHGDVQFFHTSQDSYEQKITFKDFITDDKTVIIDLSIIKNNKKQIFMAFVILSKIIHYINHSSDFFKKVIILPQVDIPFERRFIEKTMNYGRINRFLDPLLYDGFGIILMANQAHYLHENLFNYIQNIISFRATDNDDIRTLKNQMNLQELQGTGYYGSSRNNTYQIDYLMRMKDNEVIIKRSDIYQPFPANIDVTEIIDTQPLYYQNIVKYMKAQGYDLQFTEQKILEQTKKTIFEKDLGNYSMFLDDVIKFLKAIKIMDKVGNLYKSKLKEELKKTIYNKSVKITKNKKKLKNIRDELFEILIRHGYLVENHPKMASGSESIRTSYSVGDKFQMALKDYFQTKKDSFTEIIINKDDNNSKGILNPELIHHDNRISGAIDSDKLVDIMAKELSDSYYDLFQIHKSIINEDFRSAIQIEKNFLKKFLMNLYQKLFNVNYIITKKDMNAFLDYLSRNDALPLAKEEVIKLLSKCESLEIAGSECETEAIKTYNLLSDVWNKIQLKISEN